VAEITVRRLGELVQGILRVLKDKADGMRARDVVAQLERVVPPTSFEKASYESRPDVRRYEQIVRFATIGPVKAGWLVKSKGQWAATDAGREALSRFGDPEALMREARRLYKQWRAAQGNADESDHLDLPGESAHGDAGVGEVPVPAPETPGSVIEDAEGDAWDEIQRHVAKMDPYDFQDLVAGLLTAMDYHINWVAPPGADGGVDIVAYPDALGAREPCVKVSVRRRTAKADVKDVREFMSVLHGLDLGIFVSVAGFTKPAEDLARQDQRKIRLFDLARVFNLWVEHYARVSEERRRLLPLRPVWFLAPDRE
jgi:restriction system protein